jgi:hypothetical protein
LHALFGVRQCFRNRFQAELVPGRVDRRTGNILCRASSGTDGVTGFDGAFGSQLCAQFSALR